MYLHIVCGTRSFLTTDSRKARVSDMSTSEWGLSAFTMDGCSDRRGTKLNLEKARTLLNRWILRASCLILSQTFVETRRDA